MFAKTHRFHGYGGPRAVYANGKSVRGQLMSLKYAQRDERKPFRIAVVVSRKVSKSAVVRNRIRRRVYAQVRHLSAAIPGGTDLVFTVYSDKAAEIEADKLTAAVRDLLQKAA